MNWSWLSRFISDHWHVLWFLFLGIGWRAEVHPRTHPVNELEFDVIIGADGRRNTLPGKSTCAHWERCISNAATPWLNKAMHQQHCLFCFFLLLSGLGAANDYDLICVQLCSDDWPHSFARVWMSSCARQCTCVCLCLGHCIQFILLMALPAELNRNCWIGCVLPVVPGPHTQLVCQRKPPAEQSTFTPLCTADCCVNEGKRLAPVGTTADGSYAA